MSGATGGGPTIIFLGGGWLRRGASWMVLASADVLVADPDSAVVGPVDLMGLAVRRRVAKRIKKIKIANTMKAPAKYRLVWII